jgi:hypothetical protein
VHVNAQHFDDPKRPEDHAPPQPKPCLLLTIRPPQPPPIPPSPVCPFHQVLEGACGDRHSTARASLASALYFEARGEDHLALPLLTAVAGLGGDGGSDFLRGLARSHLVVLDARLREAEAAERRLLLQQGQKQEDGAAGVGKEEEEKEPEKGVRPFWGFAGAWGRSPSLDSSSDSTASVTTAASLSSSLSSSGHSWCCGGAGGEGGGRLPSSPGRARGISSHWQ